LPTRLVAIAFRRGQQATKLIDLTSETERLHLQHGHRVASVAMLHQLGDPLIEGGKLTKQPVKLLLDWQPPGRIRVRCQGSLFFHADNIGANLTPNPPEQGTPGPPNPCPKFLRIAARSAQNQIRKCRSSHALKPPCPPAELHSDGSGGDMTGNSVVWLSSEHRVSQTALLLAVEPLVNSLYVANCAVYRAM
jgi:hypothetical protein